jgi:hypothetical protein
MKELKLIQPRTIINLFENNEKIEFPPIYAKKRENLIHHLLTLYSQIQLVKNPKNGLISMERTIQLFEQAGGVSTTDGDFDTEELYAYIALASKAPRGLLVPKQKLKPKFGAMTPLFMYAHKLYNGISYSAWDREDPMMYAALGEFLAKALNFSQQYPMFSFYSFNKHHPTLRKHFAEKYNMSYTGHYPYLKYSYQEDPVDGEEEGEVRVYNKQWLIMACQFWLANVELRDTETMILDINEFGKVPKALDSIVPVTAEDKKITRDILM